MADNYEHATLYVDIQKRELTLMRASGGTQLNQDSATLKAVMDALDALSADGWEVIGPNVMTQAGGVFATSYLLRRPVATTSGEAHFS